MNQVTENLDKTEINSLIDLSKKKNSECFEPFSPICIITGLIICCYLTANVMAVKLVNIFGITVFDAGTIIFPLTYMLGDVLTEIWGFKTARKVIFFTFFCEIFMTFFTYIGIFLPYPIFNAEFSNAYNIIFNYVPRITLASLIAFLFGELINSWTLLKIREITGHKLLWIRTIGSSIFGFLVDTSVFVIIAFAGNIPLKDLFSMIFVQFTGKISIEIIFATPIAYALIKVLYKRINRKLC